MSERAAWLLALTCLVGCAAPSADDAGAGPDVATADATELLIDCDEDASGCGAPPGRYVPEELATARTVWQPDNARYVNEPTLIRTAAGTWHVISNGGSLPPGPWGETQLLHATARSLAGPWSEQPDVLSTRDPGARERVLWAPFVVRDGAGYRLFYYDGAQPQDFGLYSAHSTDLSQWQRDARMHPGGRDAFVLRAPDGRDLLYTTATQQESDGIHDTVGVWEGRALGGWRPLGAALRNPRVCPDACWGWFESPFVFPFGDQYYLFVTFTRSAPDDYQQTLVFRSREPTRFDFESIATLSAHGGEVHVEGGRTYLTAAGWPTHVPPGRQGLTITPLGWRRVD